MENWTQFVTARFFTFVLACTSVHLCPGVSSVRVTDLIVPPVVVNGSVPSVILDCRYVFDPSDRTEARTGAASGLVVKWYHNRSPAPVYQWIPGYPPQAFGLLRGRVNLGHKVSADPLMAHRGIQLVNPRPELSGEYTCRVTTWSGVASRTKRMVIYAPAKTMVLRSSEPHHGRVTLTCRADGIFPEPQVKLMLQESRTSLVELEGLDVDKTLQNGAYTISVSKQLADREMPSQCLVICQLEIPGTGYSISEKIPHIRGAASQSVTPIFRAQQLNGHTLRRYAGSAAALQAPFPVIYLFIVSVFLHTLQPT